MDSAGIVTLPSSSSKHTQIMKHLKVYRNIPFLDNKSWGFHYQSFGKRYWIELPFIGITFKIK